MVKRRRHDGAAGCECEREGVGHRQFSAPVRGDEHVAAPQEGDQFVVVQTSVQEDDVVPHTRPLYKILQFMPVGFTRPLQLHGIRETGHHVEHIRCSLHHGRDSRDGVFHTLGRRQKPKGGDDPAPVKVLPNQRRQAAIKVQSAGWVHQSGRCPVRDRDNFCGIDQLGIGEEPTGAGSENEDSFSPRADLMDHHCLRVWGLLHHGVERDAVGRAQVVREVRQEPAIVTIMHFGLVRDQDHVGAGLVNLLRHTLATGS